MNTSFPILAGIPANTDPTTTRHAFSLRYNVEEREVHVGSRAYNLLMVQDTNVLLEALDPSAFSADERLPYWAELWPSSVELACYCSEGTSLEGKTVLDLGCGLGLAGIAAATAGARVIFADYESDALQFARYNALRNLSGQAIDSRVEFRLLDWRCDKVEPVDLILGADLVYERRNFPPILNFVRGTLKPNGVAIFADPDRSTGMAFFALAEQQGFYVFLESRPLKWIGKEGMIIVGELRQARDTQ